MKARSVNFPTAVTLVGGGPVSRGLLDEARALAPTLVAADSGADRLAAMGETPEAVVGDMDSISEREAWQARVAQFVHLTEQESTDFDKCLYTVDAPLYLGVGFLGGRLDHTLAALHGMLAQPEKRVVLVSEHEVLTLLRPGQPITLSVDVGAAISIFPLLAVTGTVSEGLRWPVNGLAMAPGQQIGTSNEAAAPDITLGVDGPGAVLMLERRYLPEMVAATTRAPAV